jgi:hypothetical protein
VDLALDEGVRDMLEYKDDGYIELVLKLLARICDGQHVGLQVSRGGHLPMSRSEFVGQKRSVINSG